MYHLSELLLLELFVLNDNLHLIIPQIKKICNWNFFSAKNFIGFFLTIWMGYEIMTPLKLHVEIRNK